MRKRLVLLQGVAWTISYILFCIYLNERLARYGWPYSIAIATTSFASFATLIYGYVYFLIPRFSRTTSASAFVAIVILFYFLVSVVRFFTEGYVNGAFSRGYNTFFDFDRSHFLYDLVSNFFALIIAVLLKALIDNITSQKREAETKRKHAEAELKLLKAQVQPHFLFNSFNSLYYDTYKELPDVAKRIAMLSEIMRYFLEDSIKDKVMLKKEIEFIKNYIALEQVRFSKPIDIQLTINSSDNLMIPPMLLIPLVENLFKHGLTKEKNKASIILAVEGGKLTFCVDNDLVNDKVAHSGTGLKNLRERLHLLFPDRHTLKTEILDGKFHANLTILTS